MTLTLTTVIAALASGAVVGLLLSVFGGGGSVLATPLLFYAVGVGDAHLAIGTSAAAVSVNALAGLAAQARAGRVKWPCALVFGASGLAGSLAGSTLAKSIDGRALMVWFAVAMAAVAVSMMLPKTGEGDPAVHLTPGLTLKLAPVGALTGLAAGFFGIGGGFLIVPALIAATGMPMINAVGSSLLAVSAFGLATAINYASSGLIDWPLAAEFIGGGILGGAIGMTLAARLSAGKDTLNRIFAVVIFAVAGYVLWRSAGGA